MATWEPWEWVVFLYLLGAVFGVMILFEYWLRDSYAIEALLRRMKRWRPWKRKPVKLPYPLVEGMIGFWPGLGREGDARAQKTLKEMQAANQAARDAAKGKA